MLSNKLFNGKECLDILVSYAIAEEGKHLFYQFNYPSYNPLIIHITRHKYSLPQINREHGNAKFRFRSTVDNIKR